jgi:hypothetical protein
MDHLFAIRQKYPWNRKARTQVEMTEEQFNKAREEWRSGVLEHAQDRKIFHNIHYDNLHSPTWDTARLRKLTDQIITTATPASDDTPIMPRGRDGAPFPFRPDHKPDHWSWAHLEALMRYHYYLMWYWCDRHFPTDESPETICLEVIWQ